MTARYLQRPMRDKTQERLLSHMSEECFASAADIAKRMDASTSGTKLKLLRLHNGGLVERTEELLENGSLRALWRKIPEGYETPLYDVQMGFEAGRMLDRCLGGHTFRKITPRRTTK